jgi:hypothetical protein
MVPSLLVPSKVG